MKTPYEIIQELGSTSSSKEKEAILRENQSNKLFESVLYFTYEPSLSYYIKKCPERKNPIKGINTLQYALEVLRRDISTRVVSGAAAKTLLQQVVDSLAPENRVVFRLVVQRDLKCGISATTINKVWPDLITKPPYMRCSTKGDVNYPAYSELKADGIFCRWFVKGDIIKSVTAFTRKGNTLKNLSPLLLNEMSKMQEGVYEGELLIQKDSEILPREIGNGIINSAYIHCKGDAEGHPITVLWDYIPLGDYKVGKCNIPREKRLEILESNISEMNYVQLVPYKIVNSKQEAIDHSVQLMKQGLEGSILKDTKAIWKNGTSKDQIKMKQEVVVELEAIELIPAADGSKNSDTFGSILCRSSCGKLEVSCTGIPDKLRAEIHSNWDYYKGKVLSVKANAVMLSTDEKKPHSLFLPRFIEFRDNDKDEADSFEYIKEAFNATP